MQNRFWQIFEVPTKTIFVETRLFNDEKYIIFPPGGSHILKKESKLVLHGNVNVDVHVTRTLKYSQINCRKRR